MLSEREDLKLEINDLKMQLGESAKQLEEARVELKQATTDLEKSKSEYYLAHKKLQTIEMEHGAEVKCYQDEVEELRIKLKSAEKRLVESEQGGSIDGEELFQDNNLFDELVRDSMDKLSNHSNENRRTTAASNSMPATLIPKDRRGSLAIRGLGGEQKDQLLADAKVRELTSKIAELSQSMEDTKLVMRTRLNEIETLQNKLRDESKRLEINKRRIEAKDLELEDLRERILGDANRQSATVNEFNEEVIQRDRKIASLRRQIRAEAMGREQSKSTLGSAAGKKQPEEIDSSILGAISSFFK